MMGISRMQNGTKTSMRCAGLAAGAVLLLLGIGDTDAAAQSPNRTVNQRFPFTATVEKCGNGPVDIQGKENDQSQIVMNANVTRFKTKFVQEGTGSGLDASQYQYSSMDENTFQVTSKTFYNRMTFKERLIREGSPNIPADDWYMLKFMLFKVTNGNPEVTVENVTAECR